MLKKTEKLNNKEENNKEENSISELSNEFLIENYILHTIKSYNIYKETITKIQGNENQQKIKLCIIPVGLNTKLLLLIASTLLIINKYKQGQQIAIINIDETLENNINYYTQITSSFGKTRKTNTVLSIDKIDKKINNNIINITNMIEIITNPNQIIILESGTKSTKSKIKKTITSFIKENYFVFLITAKNNNPTDFMLDIFESMCTTHGLQKHTLQATNNTQKITSKNKDHYVNGFIA